MYSNISLSQQKSSNIKENIKAQSKGSHVINEPRYADTAILYEKETEDFVATHSCKVRLCTINLVMNKISWKGYWRASHEYIAELLGVSSSYVKQTLSRCVALGIFRSKRTYNGSNIYTLNSEFVRSGIGERLRSYFPGMRSFLSLISLLSSLTNCNFVDSIHASGAKTSTNIKEISQRSINHSYNIESCTSEGIKIEKTTKIEPERNEEKAEKGEDSSLRDLFIPKTVQEKEFSLNKDTPVALPPSEEELVVIRKKRTQDLIDKEKREQQRRSPKRLFPGLSNECILIALSTNMTPWEAMLMTSIPMEHAEHMLIAVSDTLRNSKIDSLKAAKKLTKKQESHVVYVDVFNSPKKIAFYVMHKEMKALGLSFDYELAGRARSYFGLREEGRITMKEKSEGLQSLSALLRKLDVLDTDKKKDFFNNAHRIEKQAYNHTQNGYQQRRAHKETIRNLDFEETDWSIEKSSVSRREYNKEEQSNNLITPTISIDPHVAFIKDIGNYRTAINNTAPFLRDSLIPGFTQTLKTRYPFLPDDFDILKFDASAMI